MNARAQTFADLARPLAAMARFRGPNEQLADAWRHSHSDVDDHLTMIQQHLRTIERGTDRPAYLDHCRACLAVRLPAYREAVRRVTEAEIEMRARNMRFAVDSFAWEA